ncbi:MAG: gamma-glutamylcyclotransferase [Maricaulaceae bacterium]
MTTMRTGELMAVYGLLRAGQSGFAKFGLADKVRPRGPCVIPGAIYDLGGYPGLVSGDGTVMGELYEVLDPTVTPILDAYENYRPQDRAQSDYVRRPVLLAEPEGAAAWVYIWIKDVTGRPRIDSGDWLSHVA